MESRKCSLKNVRVKPPQEKPFVCFGRMIENCLEYVSRAKAKGRRIVGIMCEYTPREIIMAADAIPVCLCGGSAEMIGPAEQDLPANLCPLIKSTYGYHVKKANPFLEMSDLVVAETTCDGKKKMFELMAKSRPMHVLELPQKPQDRDAKTHWISELRKFKNVIENRFGVKITDEKLRTSIKTMNRERVLRRQLAQLMKSKAPPLTGRQLLDFKSIVSGIPADFKQYEKAFKLLKSLSANRRPDSRVRVMITGVPMVHGAERVLDIVESTGGIVICMDNCTGLKPIWDDVDETAEDPILALAEHYLRLPCSVMTKNDLRLKRLREMVTEYKPQCIIELIWHNCITYDIEAYFVKDLAEKQLGLPYLKIDTDYSPSDSTRISLRVEALFETVSEKAGGAGDFK
ncbi:MAG: double-cubane-cluster-containing anaerobic reductase [Sedimentisphaerales bacterium]|jgi:benzoyl-CoA reductase/2-hydroxyglutaryl-CoA dehydratase subunit BcrC/BadD/HgdB